MKMMSTHTISVDAQAPLPLRAARAARGLWLTPRDKAGFRRLLTSQLPQLPARRQFHITDYAARAGLQAWILHSPRDQFTGVMRFALTAGPGHTFEIRASADTVRNDEVVMP